MTEQFISSIHIQKLGHKLLEIRERALQNIISKLDHGFVYDNDLARSKEILSKLFEWFLFEPCSQEEVVLKLIKRILQTESGKVLIQHYGTQGIISEIRQIRSCVEPQFYGLVDDIIEHISEYKKDDRPIVPPLQSDVPLSYRSEESVEKQKSESTKTFGSTASSIRGYIQQDPSSEQRTAKPATSREEESSLNKEREGTEFSFEKCLPFFHLCWQPLVAPDRHVLESIEQSLRNPPQPSSLLHSCEFFTDVMLQDFPAEVFLHRPTIVSLFFNLLSTSSSTRLSAGVLTCLQKLTKSLLKRISYYSDPCTHNMKQNVVMQMFSEVSSPSSTLNHNSERSDILTSRSRSTSSSENEKFEDTALLKTKQLSLPNYCMTLLSHLFEYLHIKPQFLLKNKVKYQAGFNIAIDLLENVITLLSHCTTHEMWNYGGESVVIAILNKLNEVFIKFGEVLEFYRLEVTSNDCDKFNRIIHLNLLHNCINLLEKLLPKNKMDFILPRNFKSALANNVLDSTFARLYPVTHESLLQIVKHLGGRYETDSLKKYEDVKTLCKSITAAVKFIKSAKKLPTLEALALAVDGIHSLEFHKSMEFVKIFVEICANKLPLRTFSESIFKAADDVVLVLLAHNDDEIREYMYKLCQQRIVTVIGPKLNTSKAGAPGSQVQFLLRSEILMEVILHGISSDNKDIQQCSEDILIHILKCKILVSESIWSLVVEALIPILTLVMCHANKQSPLGRTIMNILDPDIAKTLLIPQAEVFKGNITLLFSKDSLAREEAVSRLCWLLSSNPDFRDFLPRLNNLRDKALSAVCQLKHPSDLNKIRGSQQFYQPSSVQQVLELLNSPNVEPVIRRSALTQISVMMEDPLIHQTFLQNGGIGTILHTMKSALIETSYQDYPDALIPAISIFKQLCLYNSSLRQELNNNLELYHYVLRGMFLFCAEERVKQDGSTLLFLLLFGNVILGSPSKADLSIPKLIMDKLHTPFLCNVHWLTSKHSLPGLRHTLVSDKWCLSSIQIHWNSEWYEGFKQILKWQEINYSGDDLSKFDKLLRITNNDLLALKNSNLEHCIKVELAAIQNATSHENVIEAINHLTAYVRFFNLEQENLSEEIDIASLPWESTMNRFLSTVPSADEDTILLTTLVKFLRLLVPFYKDKGSQNWIASMLKDPSHTVFNLLQMEQNSAVQGKLLNREILSLITDCACAEQNFLDFHVLSCVIIREGDKSSWSHVIEIIAESLKFNDAQHFYNLAYLDCLLSCLAHLSASLEWSNSKSGSPPKELIVQLVSGLCELVGAFHCSKGTTAPMTLMGLSITRHAILILNHILAEMQYADVKGWDMCFLEEDLNGQVCISSLCALWMSRDVVLRAAVLQLFAGLCLSPRASTHLIHEFHDNNMNLLEVAVGILLDHEEASIVRENVAILLGNIISHTVPSKEDNLTLLVNFANKENNSVDTILLLMDQCNFYKELERILSSLYIDSTFYCNVHHTEEEGESVSTYFNKIHNEYAYAYMRNIKDVTVRSLSSSESKSSEPLFVVVTPGFVKSVTTFLNNLMPLAYDYVVTCLQENGLIKLFFRTFCSPAVKIRTTKDLAIYCDLLEMNTAICTLLSRAVRTNPICLGTVLHTRDCLNVLLSSLDPSIYHISFPQLIYLRNKLWIEIFGLIGTLIESSNNSEQIEKTYSLKTHEALNILSSILKECGHQSFIQTLCESISCSSSYELQQSALSSLTSLLKVESTQSTVEENTSNKSMQSMLDYTRTPRTPLSKASSNENLENLDPRSEKSMESKEKNRSKISVLESVYFGNMDNYNVKSKSLNKITSNKIHQNVEESGDLMAGAEICKILLHLYDISNLKAGAQKFASKKKLIIVSTLTSILCVSNEAKKYALQNGLMELIIKQLKEIHIKLSLESIDCLRRIADKKRVCPLLKELNSLIGLLINFLLGDITVKNAAVMFGLADICHKLWIWFCAQKPLMTDVLKMLCTFTTDCISACQSLPLTSSVAGTGPRKAPSNLSLLHAILALIGKEMEQISKTHELATVQLCFHLLHNVCSSVECRILLSKSSLFVHLSRLHPAITKKQKPWESVELLWLNFLETFTSYPEGQACTTKLTDILELIMSLTASTKSSNRLLALIVLRNITFYQPNRSRLLTSDDFLNILRTKLSSGSLEEKNTVVTIMWALAANSQKAKLILKCAGLDSKLKEVLKVLQVSEENILQEDLSRMHYVLNLLIEREKSR